MNSESTNECSVRDSPGESSCHTGLFKGQSYTLATMTPSKCINYCSSFEPGTYDYAGLRDNTCYCDKDSIDQFPKVPDQDCNFPCPGNPNTSCGGEGKMTVYETSKQTLLFEQTPYYTDRLCVQGNPMKHSIRFSAELTPDMCFEQCESAQYKYAGLSNGVECDCADEIDDLHKVIKMMCNTPCRGDPDELCGGDGYMDLFTHHEQ